MKLLIDDYNIFGMANLNPQKSGLDNIVIWSDHGGIQRRVGHRNTPRVKLGIGRAEIVISISDHPKLLAKNKYVNSHILSKFKPGIEYVSRNFEIFSKHFNDTTFEFDDEALFEALRKKGEYK